MWSGLGARVLVADYVGLGTPGLHTFANRIEGAHAILDGARAANAIGGVAPETPVVFWGYSQGGGATIPNHFGPEIIDGFGPDNAITYLLNRLADKPVTGCTFD